ncbi:MAG: hypothetical protein HY566_03595 [Candidatus Kerfeldbacteria bacterium]|nr:hypothetical protein [Candidatus Kerfeldbacteria bacterium]
MGGPVWYEKDVATLVNLRAAVAESCRTTTLKGNEVVLKPDTELVIIQPPVVKVKLNTGDEICKLVATVVVRVPSMDDAEMVLPLLGLRLLDGEWAQIDRMVEQENESAE